MERALAPAAAVAVVAALGVELRLFAPSREPRRGEALAWSAAWALLAVAVAIGIALTGGPAGEWTTVYLIERSLSLDNVFLFSLLLAYFFVPPELRGRVIVTGIAGALLLRGIAIVAGVALIETVEAVVYAFGLLLLYVAYRAFRGAPEQADPAASPVLRLFRRVVPTTAEFRGRRLFVREGGRLYGTPLLLVVVAIILADIAFAVDSIPAAFAVTRDPILFLDRKRVRAPRPRFPARARRDPRAAFSLSGQDDRSHSRLRRAQDPLRRPRAHQRPRLARRHRRSRRRRSGRFAGRRSSGPASPGGGGGPAPASLPPGACTGGAGEPRP